MVLKLKLVSSLPVQRFVPVEAECRLKAQQFAARRRRYEAWLASQIEQRASEQTAMTLQQSAVN